MCVNVKSIESSKLFYCRYTHVNLYICNSEMYFILYTKYTFDGSIYRYYRLTSKFVKSPYPLILAIHFQDSTVELCVTVNQFNV